MGCTGGGGGGGGGGGEGEGVCSTILASVQLPLVRRNPTFAFWATLPLRAPRVTH